MPTTTYGRRRRRAQRRGVPSGPRRSGPRRWQLRSPATKASTRSPSGTGRSSSSCAHEYFAKGDRAHRPGARQDLGRLHQGALPAVPERPGEDRRQDRRHPQAPRLHLNPTQERRTVRWPTTIEKVSDHHLERLAGRHLPGPDHGQRGAGRRNRGQPVLHLLRPRRHPQEALRAHQGRDGRQPRPAPRHLAGGLPGVTSAHDPLYGAEDGGVRHPADPRIHRDDRGYRCRAVRLQGVGRPVRVTKDDLIDQVKDIITVGEFYEIAAGGEIIFT